MHRSSLQNTKSVRKIHASPTTTHCESVNNDKRLLSAYTIYPWLQLLWSASATHQTTEYITLFKNDIHIVLHPIGINISIHYSLSARPLLLHAYLYFCYRSSLCVCFLYSCEALEFPCRRLFQGFLEDWEERVYRGCRRTCRSGWEACFQRYWDGWESLECWPCNWGNKRNRPWDLLWDVRGIEQKLHVIGRRKDRSDP